MKNRSWGGRFSNLQTADFLQYSSSIDFDQKLGLCDVTLNIAYAEVLQKAKLLTASEAKKLTTALKQIETEIVKGKFNFSVEDEDIHMNIERRLKEKVGAISGKIHTGRSRNDQVATDIRLYLRGNTQNIIKLLKKLRKVIVKQADQYIDNIMPAYTHLQMAQPIRVAHWFLAYQEMFDRDQQRFTQLLERVNVMPLGSGALAGNNFDIDRKLLARKLGFASVSHNSLDAVSDRDFALEFCFAASLLFTHFSRLSEELIIFSSQEFGTVTLPDELCTGSSIMPQKKNPDLPELLRGKAGRLNGNLVNLLTMLKGLPLAYNKDMQEDKPPLFDSCEQVVSSLPLVTEMIGKMKFNSKVLAERVKEGFITAVDLADYLVLKGMPFREAHHAVGAIVKECEGKGKTFSEMTLKEFKKHSSLFESDIYNFVDPLKSPDRKKGIGAPSRKAIVKEINSLKVSIK